MYDAMHNAGRADATVRQVHAIVKKAMAREPHERFQSAREMLEHWWNVMASLDEDATTDVMRGIGRVDESYAGPRPPVSVPEPSTEPAPEVPMTVRSPDPSADTSELRARRRRTPSRSENPAIARAAAGR